MAVTTFARFAGLPAASCSSDRPAGSTLRSLGGKVAFCGGTFHSKTLNTGLTTSKEPFLLRFSQNYRKTTCRAGDSEVLTRSDAETDSELSELLERSITLASQSKPKDIERKKISFPFYSAISNFFCDAIESGLMWAIYGSSKPTNYYMLGNYAPVDEFGPEQVLSVTGSLPECLNGEFVRIGPNPKFKPVAKYHWFDGDGMLSGLRIKDGKVSYACRYVRTYRLEQEEYWGGPKFRRIGDFVGKAGLACVLLYELRAKLGVVDGSKGYGTANTALAYHNGKLLALGEADAPYVVRVHEDGDFETVSRLDYDNKLDHPFTAHPKIDPVTGEMFTFGYQIQATPYVTYRVVSKDGVMGPPLPITGLSGPIMMHDFAITENYAIFLDCPLYFSPKEMVKNNQFAFSFDETKPIRLGVLPRYAKDDSQMRWFEASAGVLLHVGNAWEEGDEVVLVACRSPHVELEAVSVYEKEKCDAELRQLWEYRLNLKTGETKERMLGEFHTEFPRINEYYVGRKNRYVYTAIWEDATHVKGIAKFDLTAEPELGEEELQVGGNVAGVVWHGSKRYGSDPIYVPKHPGREVDEDDGYVLCFLFDENTWKSEVAVIDAKTMSSDPVAVIEIPTRVPYGFHAMFLNEEQLMLQKS